MKLNERKPYPLFRNGEEIFIIKDDDTHSCICLMWELVRALEGEYMFNEALQTIDKANALFPYCYTNFAIKFKILKKLNRLSEIISIIDTELTKDWTQPYTYVDMLGRDIYREENRRSLLRNREEYQALLNRGYVYKPRPRKKKTA